MLRFLFSLALLFPAFAVAQNDSIAAPDTAQRKPIAPPRFAMVSGAVASTRYSPWINPFSYGILHEGFNAQVSLSASVGFGKHAPRGVGFGKDLSLSYLKSLTPRLSAAVGVYGSHLSWDGASATDLGVTAMLAYRATDRLTLYAYGTKTLTPHANAQRRAFLWDYASFGGDRIGVAADYKFSEKFHMEFNVEVVNNAPAHPFFYNGVMRSGLQPMRPW